MAKETIVDEISSSECPRGEATETESARESEPGVESQTDSVIKGNLSPVSMAESGATDMSVAIGAMSDASSDKTVLGNRGGYEDVGSKSLLSKTVQWKAGTLRTGASLSVLPAI